MKKYLEVTAEIRLYPANVEFAPALFDLVDKNRTYLSQWFTWLPHTKSVENSKAFLKDAANFNIGGQQLVTAIFYKGALVGMIDFHGINKQNKSAELGYWIAENMQGKGIITKSCNRLINYGFKHMNLNRIVIRMVERNIKSEAIPKRLKFTFEGIERAGIFVHDRFENLKVYSLLKEEYNLN